MSTVLVNPGSGTSLADAYANQYAASQSQVAWLNADAKIRFDGATTSFNTNMESGEKGVNTTPPVAPFVWELTPAPPADGSAPDYFVFYAQSTTTRVTGSVVADTFNAGAPVSPLTPNVIHIGVSIGGKWYSVGAQDSFPVGMTTPPQADGHMYERYGSEMGANVNAGGFIPGWYLQVS